MSISAAQVKELRELTGYQMTSAVRRWLDRNNWPYAVGSVDGVRKGCVAVFGSPDPARGTERLVVFPDTDRATVTAFFDSIADYIRMERDAPPDAEVIEDAHADLVRQADAKREEIAAEEARSATPASLTATQVLQLRSQAVSRRLPELEKKVKELEAAIAALQSGG